MLYFTFTELFQTFCVECDSVNFVALIICTIKREYVNFVGLLCIACDHVNFVILFVECEYVNFVILFVECEYVNYIICGMQHCNLGIIFGNIFQVHKVCTMFTKQILFPKCNNSEKHTFRMLITSLFFLPTI